MISLSGIKIVELTTGIAAAYTAMAFADLGADVIKVETPKITDRDLGPARGGAASFIAWNRNKKSIAIDLESEGGKNIMIELLKHSDIFLEGLEQGIANSLGFSYESVSKINPAIIYVSIKGYLEGPYGDMPLNAHCAEALGGLVSTTGEITYFKGTYPYSGGKPLTGHPPLLIGIPFVPYAAGNYTVIAALGALIIRSKTGKGDNIRVGLFETAVSLVQNHIESFAIDETLDRHTLPLCKTKDGWAHIHPSISPNRWEGFCDAFGVSDEARKEFSTELGRSKNPEGYLKAIGKPFENMGYEEIMKKFFETEQPGAALGSMEKLLDNVHLNTEKFFVSIATDPQVTLTPEQKIIRFPMLPISESEYNPDVTRKWTPPPKLGEHTVEILLNLGYTKEGIEDLLKRKVI